MNFRKKINFFLIVVLVGIAFLTVSKTEAAIDVTKSGCDAGQSLRPCYCCPNSVTVTDKTIDIASSIDGCSSVKMIGCYQFSQSQCLPACKNANYKSFVLYDVSQSSKGNAYISNRLINITDYEMPQSTPKVPETPVGAQADDLVPGIQDDPSGIIQCGRPGQRMCTLCDLIKGINTVIQYIMKIAIGIAILAITIGGVMYVVSAGDSGLIEMAKTTMKNAVIGFVLVFAAFLIINTTMQYLGTKKNAQGEPTFGFNITSWGQFDCTAGSR